MTIVQGSWYIFIVTGLIFLLGVVSDRVGRLTKLPRVTILILFGLVIGPYGLNLVHQEISRWYPLLANITLMMVGFLLGGKFTIKKIREYGKPITVLSIIVVLMTALIVFLGLFLAGVDTKLAIILSAISTATAPAATMDVISELKTTGPFARMLEGIVALDDAWGLILFSLMVTLVQFANGDSGSLFFIKGIWEIGGALLVGVFLGFPMAYVSKWITPGKLTLVESLGYIFLCAGVSLKLEVSFLLSAMIMGSIVANFAERRDEPFQMIDEIEWPFIVIFFIIAGASMELNSLPETGAIGGVYILLRILGKAAGGFLGGVMIKAPEKEKRLFGIALLPQAGVAIGMALVASNQTPELRSEIMNIVIGTTIFFEIFGSVATYLAIRTVERESH